MEYNPPNGTDCPTRAGDPNVTEPMEEGEDVNIKKLKLFRITSKTANSHEVSHSILKMPSISHFSESPTLLKSSIRGSNLPGLTPKDSFKPNEYVYFEDDPEKYKTLTVEVNNSVSRFSLEPKDISEEELISVYHQWESHTRDLHSRKERIPENIIPLMIASFEAEKNKRKYNEPRDKKAKREEKRHETNFGNLLNKVKKTLIQEQFRSELNLAESILGSSVKKSKYEVKTLKLKGHTNKDYEDDCEKFMKVYVENKEVIDRLVDQQDESQATQQSTLSALKEDALTELMKRNKFEFLKEFTISGIPVFSPMRDAVSLNPWAFGVQRILDAPCTITTQDSTDSRNDIVHAIVPVFPSNIALAFRPIVRTRLYTMCATYAILKNPHMIDNNIHMAALGVTWVRFLSDYPNTPRPVHVETHMKNIEATAACYMDRKEFADYADLLCKDPKIALMTECTVKAECRPMKCKTIIKPMFILNMIQLGNSTVDSVKLVEIVKTIVLEYIGRCLCHYTLSKKDIESTPFTYFFAGSLADVEMKKEAMKKYVQDAMLEMSQAKMQKEKVDKEMPQDNVNLLDKFYTYDEVSKAARKVAKAKVHEMRKDMAAQIPMKLMMENVKQLRNVPLAGDVSLKTLEIFAQHVGLRESEIEEIFSEEYISTCTALALEHKASGKRLKVVASYEDCKKKVEEKMKNENMQIINEQLYKSLVELLQNEWLEEYRKAHSEVVVPMPRQAIILKAQNKGIDVTEETFDLVYKHYRPQVGLLGNACQTQACPYYLQPSKSYNNHASVERKMGTTPFVHGMHQATLKHCEDDLPTLMSKLASGDLTKEKKPVPEEAVKWWKSRVKSLKNIYEETNINS